MHFSTIASWGSDDVIEPNNLIFQPGDEIEERPNTLKVIPEVGSTLNLSFPSSSEMSAWKERLEAAKKFKVPAFATCHLNFPDSNPEILLDSEKTSLTQSGFMKWFYFSIIGVGTKSWKLVVHYLILIV